MVSTNLRRALVLAVSIILVNSLSTGCKSSEGDYASDRAAVATAGEKAAPMANHGAANTRMGVQLSSSSTGTIRTASLATAEPSTPTVRQVIRRADLDIRVDNVEKAEKSVGAIVQSAGGYTETAASSDLASAHPVLNLSLRVPASTFDSSIAKFEALGVRLSKKISSDDVTGQLVDLDARLKTLRAQEDVYRGMLKNRGQLDDVFNIQSRLTEVRTQIETIEGERKVQSGLAAMSSIALTLEQSAVANQAPADPNWLGQTWGEASSGASASFRVLSVFVIWAVAFCPFWIPVLLIVRRAIKPTHSPVLRKLERREEL